MARRQRSYPPAYREKARALRHEGMTYSEIIEALGGDIPKNTLSDWVRDVELTPDQQARIRQIERDARARGRPLAAEWHREQKRQRLHNAAAWAAPIAERVVQDADALMFMAAGLWLGEGDKRDDVLGFANSDPAIIGGWTALLRTCFPIEESKFACQLCLSMGMPEQPLKEFWSVVTGVPLAQFQKSSFDTRPKTKQRVDYKGVCKVLYFSAELRRQLGFLAYGTLEKLNKGL